MLSRHTLFWGAEGLGEWHMKKTLIVSGLEWLTCLLLFIMVEFEKLRPDLKMANIFLELDLQTTSHSHTVHHKQHIKAYLYHTVTLIARNVSPMKEPPTNQPTELTLIL